MKNKNVLMVRCPKCKAVFNSPSGGNLSVLVESALINNELSCPECGGQFLTSKPDFFYYDDSGNEQTISFKGGFDG